MAAKQLSLLPKMTSAYGGDLLKTRKGRAMGRPLSTKESMHLVLRSTMAKGQLSFRRPNHAKKIATLISRFGARHGVKIHSVANVGNHLHLQIQLGSRQSYKPFIRGLTAAIAMAVTGINRWTQAKTETFKFWDRRPFTRIIVGRRSYFGLKEYIQVNHLEGEGFRRHEARWIISLDRGRSPSNRMSLSST